MTIRPTTPTKWTLAGLAAAAFVLAVLPTATAGSSNPTDSTGEQCFSGDEHPDVTSHVTWTTGATGTTIRVTFSKNFVDNTYGANSVGWPGSKGHQFKQLVGSDHVILSLYNGDGDLAAQPKIDYISEDDSVSSGYQTLGVRGGDGDMLVGDPDDVVAVETSESKNFNTYGYVLTQDSPATDGDYTPNPQYPNWIFDVWYEVTMSSSAFGPSGFDHANMTHVHASPSKTGSNSEDVSPAPCPPPSPTPCGEGQTRDEATGECVTPCPNGDMPNEAGECGETCPDGSMPNAAGDCRQPCPNGDMPNEAGECNETCADGSMPNEAGECSEACPGDDDMDGGDEAESNSCTATGTSAPIPVFPTSASLVLATVGALGGAFVLMRRSKGRQ